MFEQKKTFLRDIFPDFPEIILFALLPIDLGIKYWKSCFQKHIENHTLEKRTSEY